ncbi:MAG: 16S rRNA (guanine(966)-N(2))-methyltransferase RsmD [Candidatus Saganbacteria bacterium]|nr:16S rRNA (guanine(966)-N(2))-methyltransferase RsmD [Candidatus Saganbacteria bacterium]
MRVISGKARGKKLKSPPRARPLTDRAKEALFNILQGRIEGIRFLDLFAGSGAVGIEALSRGAAQVVFVEQNRQAVRVIKQNLENTGLGQASGIMPQEVGKALKLLRTQGKRFDIIFLGAPYDSPDLEQALEFLGEDGLIKEAGLVIAEHRRQHKIAAEYGRLNSVRETRYGETVLTFYRMTEPASEPCLPAGTARASLE